MIEVLSKDQEIKHLQDLEYYGYTVIDNFLNQDKVKHFLNIINFYYENTKHLKYEGVPERDRKDKIIYNLPCKNLDFLEPVFSYPIEQLLKPKLNDPHYKFSEAQNPNYYLSYYNARSSGNKLDLHIDSHVPSIGSYSWMMQVIVALEDMCEENGGTVVVPGSHKSGIFTDREFKNVVPLNIKAGDIAIWDSRLWHGTTENKTNRTRWSLVSTFSSWWVKPSMDFTRSLSEEFYQRLSLREKSLLGFCSIPPDNETNSINTKKGFNDLKESISEYYNF